MKITEISSKSRKIIKKIQMLHLSFIIDPSGYDELLKLIDQCRKSDDLDLAREVTIIENQVIEELIRVLSK